MSACGETASDKQSQDLLDVALDMAETDAENDGENVAVATQFALEEELQLEIQELEGVLDVAVTIADLFEEKSSAFVWLEMEEAEVPKAEILKILEEACPNLSAERITMATQDGVLP